MLSPVLEKIKVQTHESVYFIGHERLVGVGFVIQGHPLVEVTLHCRHCDVYCGSKSKEKSPGERSRHSFTSSFQAAWRRENSLKRSKPHQHFGVQQLRLLHTERCLFTLQPLFLCSITTGEARLNNIMTDLVAWLHNGGTISPNVTSSISAPEHLFFSSRSKCTT